MYTTKEKQIIPGYGKGDLMGLHKSFGLLVAGAVVPRILLRLASPVPAELPGHLIEIVAARAGHYGQYACLVAMPATGIAMGSFQCRNQV